MISTKFPDSNQTIAQGLSLTREVFTGNSFLWPVSDQKTARFMGEFYGALKSGLSVGEAMTSTKRELMKTEPVESLAYWTAFQLYSN